MQFRITLIFLFALLFSCSDSDLEKTDLVITNANIYTLNDEAPWANSLAISNGKISAIGDYEAIKKTISGDPKIIDAENNFVMPGFIEGHGHFAGMGEMLININLLQSRSWEEIVDQVAQKVEQSSPGEWIEGRGWHQEKWDSLSILNVDGYPLHHKLSKISPDNPVILYHASGHSLFANEKAMDVAKITKETEAPMGGAIIRDQDGDAIGVFEERAMNLIKRSHQKYEAELGKEALDKKWYLGIELAQKECLSKGITSFQDAGSKFDEVNKYSAMAEKKELDIRLWTMIRESADDMESKLAAIRQIGTGDNHFTCRAIKSELDGALGSFGAWLLAPYNDKKDFIGQNTTEISELENIAKLAKANDMQLCIHAIGDRGNRESLNVIEKYTDRSKDHRWRIEHAQHLSTDDIPRFKELGVIASMQGIHCTSDAPFVEKRLGVKRAKEGAYAWRSLIDAGAIVTNGSDAPVEDVDPLASFYASVTRTRTDNGLVFFPEQRMSREEAIQSYTINNAFAAFEDELKGSLEIGKLADLVILSNDLVNCTDSEILETQVLITIVDGQIKYQKE